MNMDADTRAKLAEGVSALVRAAMAGGCRVAVDTSLTFEPDVVIVSQVEHDVDMSPPPLTLTQTLGLRLLLGDTDAGLVAAAVDAMMEAGLLPADQCEMVRQSERERLAKAGRLLPDMAGAFRDAAEVVRRFGEVAGEALAAAQPTPWYERHRAVNPD